MIKKIFMHNSSYLFLMVLDSVLTAIITVIIGVTVYAFSQMVSRFVIEPIHKHDEIRGRIAHSLIYYANVYANPGIHEKELSTKASDEFRQLASLLLSRTSLIRKYRFFSWMKLVPEMSSILKAHANLIGLSNSIFRSDSAGQNVKWADEIRQLLKI